MPSNHRLYRQGWDVSRADKATARDAIFQSNSNFASQHHFIFAAEVFDYSQKDHGIY
jgi:hypothetical protein